MTTAPQTIVFDVNETLSDMMPMRERFVDVGAQAHLGEIWFSSLLRDGFALAAAGDRERFGVIGADLLARMLRSESLTRNVDDAVGHIMLGLTELNLHPDVADGVRALTGAGHRLITLSNGSAQLAEGLLERSGLTSHFEALLSVEDAALWKPARPAYEYAGQARGLEPQEMLLVAVHPWDIHGAAAAGLRTAWLNRDGEAYPSYFTAPELIIGSVSELEAVLDAPPRA
jgi:2-haloacid dehalogenase